MDPEKEDGPAGLVIPYHRLPSGFLGSLEDPPNPVVEARPSATLALLRAAGARLEVLLLKRSPRAGFIPGAWVFPGGTVDQGDSDPGLRLRLHGVSPEDAEARLGLTASDPHALAYWAAALRETFEETGILLMGPGEPPGEETGIRATAGEDAASNGKLASIRAGLLSGELELAEALDSLDRNLDAGSLEYSGHWLTPECEPSRFETRFFATEVPANAQVTLHPKEMVAYLWLTPAEALARNRDGSMPMALPTLYTLEELKGFSSPRQALAHLRKKQVPRLLPRPERVEAGVRFHLTG